MIHIISSRCFGFFVFFHTSAPNTFFLFLCLDLVESCPIPPFPRAPDGVFPRCCCPAGAGGVGVGGGVFSGESRLVFTLVACPKRCGYQNKMSNSCYIIKSQNRVMSSQIYSQKRCNEALSSLILATTVISLSQQCMPYSTYCTVTYCTCHLLQTSMGVNFNVPICNRERRNFHPRKEKLHLNVKMLLRI